MNEYEPLSVTRASDYPNVQKWYWLQTDTGAYDGPNADWQESHEKVVKQHVKNFGVVVQAGGNLGMYPRLYADMFEQVYTFEPDPLNFYFLVNNCQKDNIKKLQCALGNEHKMIEMTRVSMENVGMHSVNLTHQTPTIPMLKLDDFEFPRLDLLHLDTEGSEKDILLGGLKNIEKHKPVILAENGGSVLFDILIPLGYRDGGTTRSDRIFLI